MSSAEGSASTTQELITEGKTSLMCRIFYIYLINLKIKF